MAGKAASGWHENYLAAAITAGSSTTVTLDRDPAFVGSSSIDRGYLVVDPHSPNCEIRKVSSNATNVVTVVQPSVTGTTGITFDATTKRLTIPTGSAQQKNLINLAYPGSVVSVTGATDAANNRVYTVADIPRDDTYVGGFITVLDPTNLMVTNATANTSVVIRVNWCKDHPVGTRVLWLPIGTRIPLMLYGLKPDNTDASAPANRAGIQRAFDEGSWNQVRHFDFPDGTTCVDDELFIEASQHLYGVNTDTTCIKAASTFRSASGGFTGGHIAIVHGRDNGVPVKYATSPLVIQRIFLERIWINGADVAGSNGLLLCLEQPHKIDDVRVQKCKGYGMTIVGTQQATLRNCIFSINGVNVRLRSVEFVWFKDCNLEGLTPSGTQTLTTQHLIADKFPGSGQQIDNTTVNFDNLHIEDAGSRPVTTVTPGSAGVPTKFNLASHNFVNDMEIAFGATTMPANLLTGPTVYYVKNATAGDFEIATTAGGASIENVTTAGTALVVRNTQTGFDIQNGCNFKWTGAIHQTIGTGSTFLKVAPLAGGSFFGSNTGSYSLQGILWQGGNPSLATAVRDTARLTTPSTLTCADYFGRQVDYLIGQIPTSTSALSPDGFHPLMILGLLGAYLRLGAPTSTGSFRTAQLIARAASSNPSSFIDFRSSADRKVFQVLPTGAFGGGANAAPVTADIAAGQFFLWLDQTATQPVLRVSAKDSAGTLFTGLDTRRVLPYSGTWSPGLVSPGTMVPTTVTVTGAAVGDIVRVSHDKVLVAGMMMFGTVSAANTVIVSLYNATGSPVTPASGTLRVDVTKYTA